MNSAGWPVTELESILLTAGSEAWVGVDPEGVIVLWSAGAALRFGCPAAAAVGRRWDRMAEAAGPAPLGAYPWEGGTLLRFNPAIEDRFALLEQACRDAVWFTTPDMAECLYASPAIEVLTGLAPSEFRRNWGGMGERILEEDRARVFALIGERAAPLETEYRIRHTDGSIRWIRDRRHASTDGAGHVRMIIGLSTDITELKAWQAQLIEAQKMDAIGQLAGGIAHDFNNLLTIINGYAKIALGSLAVADPNVRRIRQILTAGERAAELTRQLLALGRRQVLAPVPVDGNALLAEAAPLIGHLLGGSIALDVAPAAGPAPVLADPAQLRDALLQLALNARDAMPAGGVLSLAAGADGEEVWLRVRDSGIGMDAETRRRALEPFFTTKPAGQGSGLGLASVYGIVRQSQGELAIESAPGAGTTVTIRLPRYTGPEPAGAAPPREAVPVAGRLLLVEDEAAVREAVAEGLRQQGFGVVAAAGAHEALAVLDGASPIAMLLTDVRMPGLNGAELAALARQRRPGLPVLFLSGEAGTDLSVHLSDFRTGFLAKPFTPEQLAARVARLLGSA